MGKNKLSRFADNEVFSNVVQPTRKEILEGFDKKGRWAEFFGNANPLILELGCGKGEYTVALARKNPNKNYLGLDIKGARIWRGAKTALDEGINNAGFLRTQIELIDFLFAPGEVSEIWITFPDPQIKFRRAKHRLTHPEMLAKYRKVLTKSGVIHLKTDSEFLHGYTLGLLHHLDVKINYANHDIYADPGVQLPKEVIDTQTFYEKMFLEESKKITYLQFEFEQ